MHQISTVENPAVRDNEDFPELRERSETSKDRWYDDYDEYMEPPDAGEVCDDQSDISDFEDTFIKKKKKKVCGSCITYEPPRGKTNNVVSKQVRHKPACTSTKKS